jgi:hypothetical protein
LYDEKNFFSYFGLTKTLFMRKLLFLFFVSAVISVSALSQTAAKSIYAELGGPGLASINFDTRFGRSESGIGGRVGIGGFSTDGSTLLLFPIGLNYLIGGDSKNYFEVGAGATIVTASADFTDNDKPWTGTFGHLSIGYRLQPQTSGFTFRAAIVPIFGHGVFWPYWAGVSFGYKFGAAKK